MIWLKPGLKSAERWDSFLLVLVKFIIISVISKSMNSSWRLERSLKLAEAWSNSVYNNAWNQWNATWQIALSKVQWHYKSLGSIENRPLESGYHSSSSCRTKKQILPQERTIYKLIIFFNVIIQVLSRKFGGSSVYTLLSFRSLSCQEMNQIPFNTLTINLSWFVIWFIIWVDTITT